MQLRTAAHSGGCFLVESMYGEKGFSPYASRVTAMAGPRRSLGRQEDWSRQQPQ